MTVNKKTRLFALATLLVLLVTIVPAVSAGDCAGCPPPPPCCNRGPCTGTPGYWKNHPEEWPDGVMVAGVHYSTEEAIAIMDSPVRKDKTITMFKALVAAKLNKLEDKLGSLDTGKLADILVVGGNPLEDLDALEDVRMVYKEGSRLV